MRHMDLAAPNETAHNTAAEAKAAEVVQHQ